MDIQIRRAELSDCDRAQTFLQSGFWASFKSAFGWKALPFIFSRQGHPDETLLVMERTLRAGLKFAYVPHGPALDSASSPEERTELLSALSLALKPLLPAGTVFLRFDPPWYAAESAKSEEAERAAIAAGSAPKGALKPEVKAEIDAALEPVFNADLDRPGYGSPLRRAAADVQPPDTVLLDIGRSEADILAGMKPKWRYNIRLAEKKGVIVSEARALGGAETASPEGTADWRPALHEFYRLYRETSARDHIALHPESYYEKLFETAAAYKAGGGPARPDMRIWTASNEGDILASIITIFWGKQAVYLYGASCNLKRNLMPAYALQWAAIRAAKAAGCVIYDFYGIPPTSDPKHPMAGLYLFKTGFGGQNIHRGGSWDYPLNSMMYGAFRAAERARAWYYKDFKKRK